MSLAASQERGGKRGESEGGIQTALNQTRRGGISLGSFDFNHKEVVA